MKNNATVIVPVAKSDPVPATVIYSSEYNLEGFINNKYAITMSFTEKSGKIFGKYKYNTQKEWIDIVGTLDSSNVNLSSLDSKDSKNLEFFKGVFQNKKFSGIWSLPNQNKTCEFNLQVANKNNDISNFVLITDSKFNFDTWDISKIKVYSNKGSLLQTIPVELTLKENKLDLKAINDTINISTKYINDSGTISTATWFFNGSEFILKSNES